MNAPANITVPRPIRVDETGAEAAHRRSISMHCPNQDEATMAARCDIAAMRDQATSGRFRAGEAAGAILATASRVATEAVYAPLDFRRLQRIRAALHLTIEAARAMERAVADGR